MTEKQISFSGLNLTPYSDISPDGQLSASVGLEIHDAVSGLLFLPERNISFHKVITPLNCYIYIPLRHIHILFFKTVCHYIGLM